MYSVWYLAKSSREKTAEIEQLKEELRQYQSSDRAADNPAYDDNATMHGEGEGVYAEPVESFNEGLYADDSGGIEDAGLAPDLADRNIGGAGAGAGSGYLDVEASK